MTSKVEGLAKRVLNEVVHIDRQLSETAAIYEVDLVQSLISASHAEGVAEGAAEEREKIRRMQLCGRRVRVSQFPDDERRNLRIETDVDGVAYTLVPISALAPTKEQPKRGKPSQALLDELSEICGGRVEYEPKEKP